MTDHITSAELGGARLGERATLLQISSAFCAPCRAARVLLGRTAQEVDGVRHVELDVAGHEALAERLQVRATPVVVLLDGDGSVRERLDGVVPRLAWLRERVNAVAVS